MREIKFRGKTIKGGEWIYGDLIKTNGATGDGWAIQYYDPEDGWMVEDVREQTIGQYTGLPDQNCKEIYEGDIVEVTSTRFDTFMEKMKTVIVYDDDLCCYDFKATDRQRCMCNTIPDCHIEVIGNIHDNPELLNKNKL